jgi:hypothetical protein
MENTKKNNDLEILGFQKSKLLKNLKKNKKKLILYKKIN